MTPEPLPETTMTRRRFAAAALALASAPSLLAACGGEDEPSGSAAAGGPWTFEDDRGETVSREARPRRVVAYETAAAALWYQGIVPTAVFGGAPPAGDNPTYSGLDVARTTSVGEVYGEINLEQLAALKPDLIVTAYDPDQQPLFGFKDDEQQRTVEGFAPIVAIDSLPAPTKVIDRFGRLATALGADPQAPARREARKRFDAAVAGLRETAAARRDVAVVAVGPFEDGLYFARPQRFPALQEYAGWGVSFAEVGAKPTAKSEQFDVADFWQVVSYEQADRYPADLILHDTLPGSLDLEALAKRPTWRALPAVREDQLVPWRKLQAWSHPQYTAEIEQITAGLQAANPALAT